MEGNFTATAYSVEATGNTTNEIVITVATNLSKPPATLTNMLMKPLEQMLEEIVDINDQISFAIVSTERHDM